MKELTSRYEIERRTKEEGDEKMFVYQGVTCEIKRIGRMGHLCGYLHLSGLTEDMKNEINEKFHHGITYEDSEKVGFDCMHVGDIQPAYFDNEYELHWPGETYKTMAYVEDCLKRTVDGLLKKGMIE